MVGEDWIRSCMEGSGRGQIWGILGACLEKPKKHQQACALLLCLLISCEDEGEVSHRIVGFQRAARPYIPEDGTLLWKPRILHSWVVGFSAGIGTEHLSNPSGMCSRSSMFSRSHINTVWETFIHFSDVFEGMVSTGVGFPMHLDLNVFEGILDYVCVLVCSVANLRASSLCTAPRIVGLIGCDR
jgi:hypothetical protein